MVGVRHPATHTAAKTLRQLIIDVSDLVELATLDHRMVEHVDDRLAQRLGPVDADQDRAGDVQAALAQAHQQLGDQGGVLGDPSTKASGCLVPSMPIPSATTQHGSAKCTPSIINATRSSPDRSAASSSASAVSVAATNRRETADLLVDDAFRRPSPRPVPGRPDSGGWTARPASAPSPSGPGSRSR